MKIKAEQTVDVWSLLCHEGESHSFSGWELRNVLNQRLAELQNGDYEYVRLTPPDEIGLDYWIVEWKPWNGEESILGSRIYAPKEARDKLPSGIVTLLDKLNKENFVLSPD